MKWGQKTFFLQKAGVLRIAPAISHAGVRPMSTVMDANRSEMGTFKALIFGVCGGLSEKGSDYGSS